MIARSPSKWNTLSHDEGPHFYRKEKNKEHAKLARDRKKLYIEKLKETIVFFEDVNAKMAMTLRNNHVVVPNNLLTQSSGFAHTIKNTWGMADEQSAPLDYI